MTSWLRDFVHLELEECVKTFWYHQSKPHTTSFPFLCTLSSIAQPGEANPFLFSSFALLLLCFCFAFPLLYVFDSLLNLSWVELTSLGSLRNKLSKLLCFSLEYRLLSHLSTPFSFWLGSALPNSHFFLCWNLWIFGHSVSLLLFRYSCQHSHFWSRLIYHLSLRLLFALQNALLPSFLLSASL